jgi:hypothetical protein
MDSRKISVAELEAIEAAGTSAPWGTGEAVWGSTDICLAVEGARPEERPLLATTSCDCPNIDSSSMGDENAALIIAARNALPALLRLARAAHQHYHECADCIEDSELRRAIDAFDFATSAAGDRYPSSGTRCGPRGRPSPRRRSRGST